MTGQKHCLKAVLILQYNFSLDVSVSSAWLVQSMSLERGFLFGTRKRRHYYFRAACHPSFLILSIPRLAFLVN